MSTKQYLVKYTPDFDPTIVNVSQNDVGRQFDIKIIDESGTAQEIPTGSTVTFVGTKPSGLGFTVNCTFNGAIVHVTTTDVMTDEYGLIPAEVRIVNGTKTIGMANVNLRVEKNPHPDGTIDDNIEHIVPTFNAIYQRLTALETDVAALKPDVSDLKSRMTAAETTLGNVEGEVEDQSQAITNIGTELGGIRTGYDGTVYQSAGDAVRAQAFRGTDRSLSVPGKAADAAAVGEKAESIKNLINILQKEELGVEEEAVVSAYDARNETPSADTSPFILYSEGYNYSGAVLTSIKISIVRAGTLSIGYIAGTTFEGVPYDFDDLIITNTIMADKTGVITFDFSTPFIVPEGFSLFVGAPGDTARFYYGFNGTEIRFFYVDPSTSKYHISGSSINMDIMGMPILYTQAFLQETRRVNMIASLLGLDTKKTNLYDGYSDNNVTISTPTASPFVINKDIEAAFILRSMRLKLYQAGTITIGAIKKAAAREGEIYDSSKYRQIETITLSGTGDITYAFSDDHVVNADEYLCIQSPAGTARWRYGTAMPDTGFLFVDSSTNKFTGRTTSLGLTLQIECIDGGPIGFDSIYKGKTLSILGDSISTFSGYIPEGNASYYPSGTVTTVGDTWWMKLIDALEMTLDVNNSWSGSRVTTTAGDASAGCMTRCETLGTSPDVIIVWMGINDFNNEVQVGTYDGTMPIPTETTSFREAYAIMLNKILTKYQTSEVWVCTLPQCERNAETGFPEINGNGVALAEFNKAIKELAEAFGVKILDHNTCGLTYQNMPTYNPDNLHPNKLGHSLIANNDIRQMDEFVRKRY